MLRSTIALVLIVGGLIGVNWFLKNRATGILGNKLARRMKLIEKFSIDQKRSLLLISLDGREILLGVGGDTIQHLTAVPSELAQKKETGS
ncbi:MAG: flagellar biosynthetic protein FliO [Lentisphaerota bacterium]